MRDYDLIINVQGDEPLIDPGVIDALVEPFLADEKLPMATAKTLLTDEAEMENPNNVKVIVDRAGNALYFSRARIPYARNPGAKVYKHIGIYAYRRDFPAGLCAHGTDAARALRVARTAACARERAPHPRH